MKTRRARRQITEKEKQMYFDAFAKGKKPSHLAAKYDRTPSTMYRYFDLWKSQNKVDEYVKAIGPDKPSVDWAVVGAALMKLGRALGGTHPV